jgi:glyoxylase-like metal-dependent hydrolase (beta-lactamase superfamily II)
VILQQTVVGRLQANCYLVGDEDTHEIIVVDPGDDAEAIIDQIRTLGHHPVAIFVTHSHLDHSGAAHELLEAFPDAVFAMAAVDYQAIALQAPSAPSWYGHAVTVPRVPERVLIHGDALQAGRHRFTALSTPGHTQGSMCLAGEGVVFTGDVLFQGSIGRFDLPGGDGPTLIRSIREHLLTLPPETAVLPGHGPASTIEVEARRNPYLAATRQILGWDPDDE